MNKKIITIALFMVLLTSVSFVALNEYVLAASVQSSISIVFLPHPASVNSPITFIATVSGSTPTGTITWTSNSTTGTFNSTSTTITAGTSAVNYTDSQLGVVTITATYGGDSSNLGSSASYNLTIYKNVDFNHDGSVNFKDTVFFVAAYISASNGGANNGPVNPACDLNNDGKINFNDLKIYVAAYQA